MIYYKFLNKYNKKLTNVIGFINSTFKIKPLVLFLDIALRSKSLNVSYGEKISS